MTHIRILPLVLIPLLATLVGCPNSDGSGPFGGSGPFDGSGNGGVGNGNGNGSETDGLVMTGETGPDGCEIVELDPSAWNPLYAAYEGGNDPFFHMHSTEDVLFFSAELYTEYGAGWTGQTGTFNPLCGDNGICVYLVPDGETVTRAVAGSVDVVTLSESGGQMDRPAEVVFRDMTFQSEEDPRICFHVEEVTLGVN